MSRTLALLLVLALSVGGLIILSADVSVSQPPPPPPPPPPTPPPAVLGDAGFLLKRSHEETCHACHKTDKNAPLSDPDSIKTHDSSITGSGKWSGAGGWGVAGGKYGQFICTTCHTAHDTKNIYLVREIIMTPDGSSWNSSNSQSLSVDFQVLSGIPGNTAGLMGDDYRDHSSSVMVCQVCHSQTQHHRYNSDGLTTLEKSHYNAQNCAGCHNHKGGFKPQCKNCHGFPPAINTPGGPSGLAKYTDNTGTGSNTAGAHVLHATSGASNLNYECAFCHASSVGTGAFHNNANITLGFNFFGGTVFGGTYNGQVIAKNYQSSMPGSTFVNETNQKICSNVYCHGSTMPGNASGSLTQNPVWSSTGLTCASLSNGSCHGASTSNYPTRGSHTKHTAATGGAGYGFDCETCHSSSMTLPYIGKHVTGTVDWAFSTVDNRTNGALYNGLTSGSKGPVAASPTYNSCTNLYCHSNASPVANIVPEKNEPNRYATVQWGQVSPPVKCFSCHKGRSDADASPNNDNTQANCTTVGGFWDQYCNTSRDNCISGGYNWDPQDRICRGLTQVTCETTFSGRWISICITSQTDSTALLTMNSNAHDLLVTPRWVRRYPCTYCHNSVVDSNFNITDKTKHVDGIKQVVLQTSPIDWTTNSYGMNFYYDTNPSSETYLSCMNNYCHSDGTKKPEQTRPFAWTRSGAACNDCHGHPTGSCEACHDVANGQTPTKICSGMNRTMCESRGGTWYNGVVCSNLPDPFDTNCNPPGWVSTTQPTICASTATSAITKDICESWDGVWMGFLCNGLATATCASLGGQSSWPAGMEWMGAAPMYPSEGAGADRANSHARHVMSGFSCSVCHVDTIGNGVCSDCHTSQLNASKMGETSHVNATFHVNRFKTVTWTSSISTQQYDYQNKTCQATVCHQSNTPTWGGNVGDAGIACTDCHLWNNPDKDFYGTFTHSDSLRPMINSVEWYSAGHGRLSGSGPYPSTGNPAANFAGNQCAYCHDNKVLHTDSTNPFRLKKHDSYKRRFEKECAYCHMAGTNFECMGCHSSSTPTLAPQLNAIGADPSDTWPDGTPAPRPSHVGYTETNPVGGCITSACHFVDPNYKVNMLADQDFEDTTSGWQLIGIGTDIISSPPSLIVNGSKSLRLTAGGSTLGRSQTLQVTPGAQYVLSGYIYTDLTSGRALCGVYQAGTNMALAEIIATGPSKLWLFKTSGIMTTTGISLVDVRCYADGNPQGLAYFDFIQFGSSDMKIHNTNSGFWSDEKKLDIKNQYIWMGVCLKCHDDDSNNQCQTCHTGGQYVVGYDGGQGAGFSRPAVSSKASSDHFGYKHYSFFEKTGGWVKKPNGDPTGITMGGKFCWDCHDPHGDTNAVCSNNPATACSKDADCSPGTCSLSGSTNNIIMIQRHVSTSTDGKYGKPLSYGCSNTAYTTQDACETNGARWMTSTAGVTFSKRDSTDDFALSSAPTPYYPRICNVCHISGTCSIPQYVDQFDCENATPTPGVWTERVKTAHFTPKSGDSHNMGRGGCSDKTYYSDRLACIASGAKWNYCTNCHNHIYSDSHASGTDCNSCHQGKPVPRHAGFGLPRDCTKCHIGLNKRTDVMGQMAGNGHHVQGKELGMFIENRHCYPCHWESSPIGLIDIKYHQGYNYKTHVGVKDNVSELVVWGPGTRPTTYTETGFCSGTGVGCSSYTTQPTCSAVVNCQWTLPTAVTFSAMSIGTLNERSDVGKVTTHCLSCHSDQNNDTRSFGYCSNPKCYDQTSCQTTCSATWITDCKVPKQYAWDQQSIAARYSRSCSIQIFNDQTTCEINGGTWAPKTTSFGKYVSMPQAVVLPMDEVGWNSTSNEVVDSSPNGNHLRGYPTGSPYTGPTTVVGGKFGRAGYFDGSNDYLYRGAASSLNTEGPVSISVWIKFNAVGTDQMIVQGVGQYALQVQSNQFRLSDTAGSYVMTSGFTPVAGQWYHVAGVFSGTKTNPVTTSNAKIYINGVAQTTTVGGTWNPGASVSGLYIGASTVPDRFFNGLIDQVVVYKGALNSGQVQTLAQGLVEYVGCDPAVCKTSQKNITKSFSSHGDTLNNLGGGWETSLTSACIWPGMTSTDCTNVSGTWDVDNSACRGLTELACRTMYPTRATQSRIYSFYATGLGNDFKLNPTRGGSGSKAVQCFDCHSSHGSKLVGITSSYVTSYGNLGVGLYGGNLKETVSGKGGYVVDYKASANSNPSSVNPYNAGAGQCFDCHQTATGGTSFPWGYSTTFGATASIKGYKDTSYFGQGTKASQTRYTYRSSKNTIVGGHLKASSALTTNGNNAALPINGLCTGCHDPHGVSPTLGDNQEYAVPLLKGTWLTSPYREDTAQDTPGKETGATPSKGFIWLNPNPTPYVHTDKKTFSSAIRVAENDTKFAGLCLNCHPKANLTTGTNLTPWRSIDRIHGSVAGWGGIEHFFTCSKCHQPHNSGLPRLMLTDCLETKHRGRVPSGGYAAYGGNNDSYGTYTANWGTCSNNIGKSCTGGSGSAQCPGGTCLGSGDNLPITFGTCSSNVVKQCLDNSDCTGYGSCIWGNNLPTYKPGTCDNTVYTSRDDCKSHGSTWRYGYGEGGRSAANAVSGGFPRGLRGGWQVQCHPTTEGWPNNEWNNKTLWP